MSKLYGAAYQFGVYSELFTILFFILGSSARDLFFALLSCASAISSGATRLSLSIVFHSPSQSRPAMYRILIGKANAAATTVSIVLNDVTGCLLLSSPDGLSRREFLSNPAGAIAFCKFLVQMEPEGYFDTIDQLKGIKEGMEELDAYEKTNDRFVPVLSHRFARPSRTVQSAPKPIPPPATVAAPKKATTPSGSYRIRSLPAATPSIVEATEFIADASDFPALNATPSSTPTRVLVRPSPNRKSLPKPKSPASSIIESTPIADIGNETILFGSMDHEETHKEVIFTDDVQSPLYSTPRRGTKRTSSTPTPVSSSTHSLVMSSEFDPSPVKKKKSEEEIEMPRAADPSLKKKKGGAPTPVTTAQGASSRRGGKGTAKEALKRRAAQVEKERAAIPLACDTSLRARRAQMGREPIPTARHHATAKRAPPALPSLGVNTLPHECKNMREDIDRLIASDLPNHDRKSEIDDKEPKAELGRMEERTRRIFIRLKDVLKKAKGDLTEKKANDPRQTTLVEETLASTALVIFEMRTLLDAEEAFYMELVHAVDDWRRDGSARGPVPMTAAGLTIRSHWFQQQAKRLEKALGKLERLLDGMQ